MEATTRSEVSEKASAICPSDISQKLVHTPIIYACKLDDGEIFSSFFVNKL